MTRKVYVFTITNLLKNKANRTSLIIICIIMFLAIPVAYLFLGDIGPSSSFQYVGTGTYHAQDYFEAVEDEIGSMSQYSIQLVYSIIILMMTIMMAGFVIRGVVEEKSSKLIETLLLSIPSSSMIFGKLLASISYVVLMFVSAIISFLLSRLIFGFFFDVSAFIDTATQTYGINLNALNLGWGIIAIALVSIVLACLQFGLVASISAAGCSNIEEIGSAMSMLYLFAFGGYFAAIMSSAFENHTINLVFSFVPVISAFCAFANYITNEIGFWQLVISWLIQVGVIFVMVRLAGAVYNALILYKGKPLGFIKAIRSVSRKGAF